MNHDDAPTLQRRRNSRYGAFFVMLGVVMIFMGAIGCFNAAIQFVVLRLAPNPPRGPNFDLWRQINLMMLLLWAPLPLAGLAFAASGFYIRRHRPPAMRIARWTALAGYGWGAAMVIDAALILYGPWRAQMLGPLQFVKNGATIGFWLRLMQMAFSIGLAFGPPSVLLWMLRRVRPVGSVKSKC